MVINREVRICIKKIDLGAVGYDIGDEIIIEQYEGFSYSYYFTSDYDNLNNLNNLNKLWSVEKKSKIDDHFISIEEWRDNQINKLI